MLSDTQYALLRSFDPRETSPFAHPSDERLIDDELRAGSAFDDRPPPSEPPSPTTLPAPTGDRTTPPSSTPPTGLGATTRMRKPPGEVTRLAREGYNLRETVKWADHVYDAVQVRFISGCTATAIPTYHWQKYIRLLAEEHLRPDLAFSKQEREQLELVYEEVSFQPFPNGVSNHPRQAAKKFPILTQYDNNWVTIDFLKMRLKNTAQRQKAKQITAPGS